ncbi:MAG: hypothetical protein JNK68_14785 [Betaproteobacteria bacterium]|nr:hypothetical protein [Betaproteobacteria bacterium]
MRDRPLFKTCALFLCIALPLAGCASTQQRSASSSPYYAQTATPQQVTPRYGSTTDGEAMLLDTVFLRPVSLVGVAVGAAAWIVSLPFSLPSGSSGEAWGALVETPLNYTFSRPLGDVSSCRDVDPGCQYPQPW